ncbi:hypothetical protein C8N35_102107 [Breoghania corrubedonensis]|uniref:Uncharacterized protein n=1 Tax=Breoghania corrubedonensis TaxID=665038 RepID=A0A2T5VCC9_9HYPH|nr:hypothetical protein [Breoghania corrubedonensis]PTW61398.1 hypothetical protein C8N35_102107 [Breoghania corrubedonensis]
MTSIWFNPESAQLKSYSSTSRGRKAVVKIEIEVTDLSYLGFLLQDLARAEYEQASPSSPYRPQPKSADEREKRRRLRNQAALALPAPGGDPS